MSANIRNTKKQREENGVSTLNHHRDKCSAAFVELEEKQEQEELTCPQHVCVFSESEDEVEEIEERVPSPDVAPEESAPFYDPSAWYGSVGL